jgi:acetyltransferase-like isoleucine patch superfamily enzyme
MADTDLIDLPDGTFQGAHKLRLSGTAHKISVAAGSRLYCNITVSGHGNTIDIGLSCVLRGDIFIAASGAKILIGAGTTSMGTAFAAHEAELIDIGPDCMFAGGVSVSCSDMHSIIDATTGKRINRPLPVQLGRHCWIGRNVTILKGANISRDCIIGAGAVVGGTIPPNSIAAGVPARVIRSGVTWDRRRLPFD